MIRLPLALLLLIPATAFAQSMPGMDMDDMAGMHHDMGAMPQHDRGQMDMAHMAPDGSSKPMSMPAMLGPYAMNRESSGTSWQPDASPMLGRMFMAGDWMLMAQGFVTGIYDDQGGPRGDSKAFSSSMAMLMGSRPLGDKGRLGLRAMLSLDPLMGKSGYPLLFATGETADGQHQLIDRQHPHDLFMELAASYSYDLGGGHAVSLYGGLPGEPALGPPTFMHRLSGMADPEAPIGHHWFDSTHITYGVVTAGVSGAKWKVEASAFKGREPDQYRWNIETPKLDSWAVRAWFNPTSQLSMQVSTGHLHSPEQLEPQRNEQRTTASVSYTRPIGKKATWATTFAYSHKNPTSGRALDGWLAESALMLGRHTLYGRAEREREDELFGHDASQEGQAYTVGKASLGYQYALPLGDAFKLALGGLASGYTYSDRLVPTYGRRGIKSFMVYTRLSFGQ